MLCRLCLFFGFLNVPSSNAPGANGHKDAQTKQTWVCMYTFIVHVHGELRISTPTYKFLKEILGEFPPTKQTCMVYKVVIAKSTYLSTNISYTYIIRICEYSFWHISLNYDDIFRRIICFFAICKLTTMSFACHSKGHSVDLPKWSTLAVHDVNDTR